MSGAAPAIAETTGYEVRTATLDDLTAVVAGVSSLLAELGATPPSRKEMRAAASALIAEEDLGLVLVAQARERIVGVLAASLQTAIHAPGRYLLIQDLWVDTDWRSRAIGAELLDRLVMAARERHLERIEVGLPAPRFATIEATGRFYSANGFTPLGPRMRRVLS